LEMGSAQEKYRIIAEALLNNFMLVSILIKV
jgi:hypothetical protein